MQQKLIKKILANFNIPILDILIFLNLDHVFKFRHELLVSETQIKFYLMPPNTLNAKALIIWT